MDSYHKITDIAARLNNHLTLDYTRLEAIYVEFKEIEHDVNDVQMKEIEKNIRRMHRPGSILKKDVAFLMARNGLVSKVNDKLKEKATMLSVEC